MTSPLPLVWHAPLRGPSGYGDEARTFLLALESIGRPAAAAAVSWDTTNVALPEWQARAVRAALGRAPAREHVLVHHVQPSPLHGRNEWGPDVARTMYETDRIPARWPARLMEVDEVWVPCAFNLDTFERGGVSRERLHLLPETMDFALFDPAAAAPRRWPGAHGFVFLTSFDFTDRKGWDVLIDAWADAFGPDDDVTLVLKCGSLEGLGPDDIRARLEARLGGRPAATIVVDGELLPAADVPGIYAGADAFVLATRGEGWGRPPMEALAMGLPTIASAWSGNLEFMHPGNSWLIEGEVVPVRRWRPLPPELWKGHRWFEPDREALAAALREVATLGPAARERAAGAREDLIARFGPEPVANRLVELAEGALERWRARQRLSVACVWRGPWGSASSLALVNDAHAGEIEAAGLAVERRAPNGAPVPRAVTTVTSSWPPVFAPASAGPLVLYQPWEYGRIPAEWLEEIRRGVDEVWTPSAFARQAFVDSGVAPELVHVVPNGVDLARFTPAGPRRPLPTTKGTVLLFVGGTIFRKGVDLLLEAYGRAFGSEDDVCLVVKATGAAGAYDGQTADAALARFGEVPGAPELVMLDEDLPSAELPALYRAADVLVQPYRAEGFCLPVLEGLACGLPIVVTAGGPTDDVVSDACAWRIPAARRPLPPSELELVGEGWMLEPDVDALIDALRAAVDPAARAAKAACARTHAAPWGWDSAAAAARARLDALAGVRPVRALDPVVIPERRRVLFGAMPAWDRPETWEPVVTAYARAFGPDADTTLLLRAADETDAGRRVLDALARAALDPALLADVAIAPGPPGDDLALELGCDAIVHAAGPAPTRARLIVPPDPAALRAAVQ
ncbi:MAG: hypothetical protein QOD86_1575 [Miltoncostaeaceae bacterium]|nr:hypothetical protein [Miltoncostaeaceae bacterium]